MFSTQFYVCRNIQVQSNVENVYATVADFRKWPQWSPWICKEPSCKYETFNEPRQKVIDKMGRGTYRRWRNGTCRGNTKQIS